MSAFESSHCELRTPSLTTKNVQSHPISLLTATPGTSATRSVFGELQNIPHCLGPQKSQKPSLQGISVTRSHCQTQWSHGQSGHSGQSPKAMSVSSKFSALSPSLSSNVSVGVSSVKSRSKYSTQIQSNPPSQMLSQAQLGLNTNDGHNTGVNTGVHGSIVDATSHVMSQGHNSNVITAVVPVFSTGTSRRVSPVDATSTPSLTNAVPSPLATAPFLQKQRRVNEQRIAQLCTTVAALKCEIHSKTLERRVLQREILYARKAKAQNGLRYYVDE